MSVNNLRKRTNHSMKEDASRYLVSFFMVSLLFFSPLYVFGQLIEVNFSDSLSLNPDIWQGTLDRFVLTGRGLQLKDEKPRNTYNQAWLRRSYTNGKNLSWSGSLEFDVKPTRQNAIDILLYPIKSKQDESGIYHTYYMALSVGESQKAELQRILVSRIPEGNKLQFEERTVVISNTGIYLFPDKTTNKLDFVVTFDTENKCWQLFVRNYNPYEEAKYTLIGIEEYDTSYEYLYHDWLNTTLCFTYSKRNSSAFTCLSLGFYPYILDPSEDDFVQGSIISDISYDEKSGLRLHCHATPRVEEASFLLEPGIGFLYPHLDENEILLPMDAPLKKGSYRLTVEGIRFPDGNLSPKESFQFDIVEEEEEPQKTDNFPLLSEVMPYPEVEGPEYVELYNAGEEEINLTGYGLMLRKEGHLGKIYPIKGKLCTLSPKEYKVLTPWADALCRQFPSLNPLKVLEMERFPSLPNNEGQLAVVSLKDSTILETLYYDYKSYAFDNKKRGYSLERIAYQLKAEDRDNWAAARESAGYATPGESNSVAGITPDSENEENELSLRALAKLIIASLEEKGSNARVIFYTLKGEKVQDFTYTEAVNWAEKFLQNEFSSWFFPLCREPLLFSLYLRIGTEGEVRHYSIPFISPAEVLVK